MHGTYFRCVVIMHVDGVLRVYENTEQILLWQGCNAPLENDIVYQGKCYECRIVWDIKNTLSFLRLLTLTVVMVMLIITSHEYSILPLQ